MVVADSDSTSAVRVSWEAVEDADYYTVSFSAAVGDNQEGLCTDDYHSANVTVNVSTASIAVREDVDSNETSLLRVYTTYSVTVVAFSSVWGRGSVTTMFTVFQKGKHKAARLLGSSLNTGSAAAPGNVSAIAVSSTVISVQWSGLSPCRLVNGLIVKYRVQYRAQSGGMVQSKEVAGNWSSGAETELTGLTPSTYYSIEVAAVNEDGDVGVYSHPVTVKTLPGKKPTFFFIKSHLTQDSRKSTTV